MGEAEQEGIAGGDSLCYGVSSVWKLEARKSLGRDLYHLRGKRERQEFDSYGIRYC